GWPFVLVILIPIGADLCDSADIAPLNQVHSTLKMGPASLLHPTLENAVGLVHSLNQLRALVDGMGNRLFQINVLSGSERITRHPDVPVIRSGDDDGIDIVLAEHLAIVDMRGRRAVRAVSNIFAARSVDIASGNQFVAAGLIGTAQKVAHAAS